MKIKYWINRKKELDSTERTVFGDIIYILIIVLTVCGFIWLT